MRPLRQKKDDNNKNVVQPASGSFHPRTSMGILGGNPLIQMYGLGGIFQGGYNNYMVAEASEEYTLDYLEAAYEYSGQEANVPHVVHIWRV